MQKQTMYITLAVWLAITAVGGYTANAGDINPPPGPVAPTMKTLTEVEPRTPIWSLPFEISSSGSYYLATSLTGIAGADGITIDADDVTLDLNGFALTGGGESLQGIKSSSNSKNIAVHNGTVRAWGGHGIFLQGSNHQVYEVRASDNGADGIKVGTNSSVRACVAQSNGATGIATLDGSSVLDSIVSSNGGGGGIETQNGSTVRGCTAYSNEDAGILTGIGCMVIGCAAYDNGGDGIHVSYYSTVVNCTAYLNADDGIFAGGGCTIQDCTPSDNSGDGIEAHYGSRIIGNTCHGNGFSGADGAGIHITGPKNCIEGNNITDSDRGIDVDSPGNLIIKNSTGGEIPTDYYYVIVPGNDVGPIGNAATATSCWANIEF